MSFIQSVHAAARNKRQLRVAITGEVGRTWYMDEALLQDILTIILEAYPSTCFVDGGQAPFDLLVARYAAKLGAASVTYGEELDVQERLAIHYQRPLSMLDGCHLLFGFPKPVGYRAGHSS